MSYILGLRKELGPERCHRPLIMAGAGILFVNERNEILLQKRADNGFWGWPGGSLELGESFEEAAIREAKEESGLICDEIEFFSLESGKETHYIYPNGDEIYCAGAVFFCRKYHGELKIQEDEVTEQRFFSFEDLPDDLDPINKPFILRAFEEIKSKA
ncbi:MAG: NUDIX hydrolase [Clostridiales bacterium]|nr:NUDIX hydrolase [Clostridiales bacterium]